MMPLSDAKIRALKPREKPYRVTDGQGLCLRVAPTGALSWQLHFALRGRRQILSLGLFPEVSIRRAREKTFAARMMLADGKDPRETMCRGWQRAAQDETLQAIFDEWLRIEGGALSVFTVSKVQYAIAPVLLELGARPISSIKPPELLAALRKIEAQGKHATAHRARQRVGQLMRYAIATGRAEHDITADLRGALAPVVTTNHAAIVDPGKLGELLKSIDSYVGQPSTQAALRLAPLVFLRSWELRGADWKEFQLEGATPEWRVPGTRMKMKEQHIVPLARQAVAILRELHALTGPAGLVFPGLISSERPIAHQTLNVALKRMGYAHEDHVIHGFRATASTLLNERGYHPDLIELQLAHAERNKVRAAYNRAQRLPERRQMMQAWADYLDGLKAGSSNVVPIPRGSGA
jgi:integrase